MLDEVDRKILVHLQNNGRQPYSSIAKKLSKAASSVHERIRKMEFRGDIIEYSARVKPQAVGLELLAFIHFLIAGQENEQPFLDYMTALPEVEECFDITGEWSFLLKVRLTKIEELSQFRRNHIDPRLGVARTNTSIVIATCKETLAVRL